MSGSSISPDGFTTVDGYETVQDYIGKRLANIEGLPKDINLDLTERVQTLLGSPLVLEGRKVPVLRNTHVTIISGGEVVVDYDC